MTCICSTAPQHSCKTSPAVLVIHARLGISGTSQSATYITGAVDEASVPQKRRPDGLAERARRGGLPMKLAFATCHLVMHLGTAVCLMLLLELATETFIR